MQCLLPVKKNRLGVLFYCGLEPFYQLCGGLSDILNDFWVAFLLRYDFKLDQKIQNKSDDVQDLEQLLLDYVKVNKKTKFIKKHYI